MHVARMVRVMPSSACHCVLLTVLAMALSATCLSADRPKRFVLTFHEGNALEQYERNSIEGAVVDKWYGRRIVLRYEDAETAQGVWGYDQYANNSHANIFHRS